MEPGVFRIAMKSIWTSFLTEGQSVSKADKTHADGSQGHLLSPALVAQQLLSQRFLHLLDALLMGNQHQFPESHKTNRWERTPALWSSQAAMPVSEAIFPQHNTHTHFNKADIALDWNPGVTSALSLPCFITSIHELLARREAWTI